MAEFIAITPIKFFCHTHTHTYPHTHPHIPTHPPTHTHMHTLRMTEALTLSKNIMALSAQTLLMAGNVQGGGSKLIFELVRVLYCQLVHQHHYHLSLSPSPSSLFPPTPHRRRRFPRQTPHLPTRSSLSAPLPLPSHSSTLSLTPERSWLLSE